MSSFQSFTGSARRPRQVNLSGRATNPFAASSAVANAQQDRANRQQQRERLNSSIQIQRVWRGHASRRRTHREWRQKWIGDEHGQVRNDGAYSSEEESLEQLRRLMLFYSPSQDSEQLIWYGMRQRATADALPCHDGSWPTAYLKIVHTCLSTLRKRKSDSDESDRMLLTILSFAVSRTTLSQEDAVSYYEILTSLSKLPSDVLQVALVAPMRTSPEGYVGLAVLLTRPLDRKLISLLQSAVDAKALTAAVILLPDRFTTSVISRLWLLGNVICLAGKSGQPSLIKVTGELLGSLTDDVDFDQFYGDREGEGMDNAAFDRRLRTWKTRLPVNKYLHENISSLVDQHTIRNLLRPDDTGTNLDADTMAAYALALLRSFPQHADDIRMWLYLGPPNYDGLPPAQYFWRIAKESPVFMSIRESTRDVISLIRGDQDPRTTKKSWTRIMVFLELYTFVLKIMDDEEFAGASTAARRNSPVPIDEVADLVSFLKNLGFMIYFNMADLNREGGALARDGNPQSLRQHFGTSSTDLRAEIAGPFQEPVLVGDIPGMTIDYLKGVVTGLLRAVYERDSRRHFLPSGHWLMTGQLDMSTFISGVVLEEEHRRQLQENQFEDEDLDYDSEEDWRAADVRRSMGHIHRQARLDLQSQRSYMQKVAPRLEVVQNMPFLIPFTTRVEIFREFVHLDQYNRRMGHVDPDQWRAAIIASMGGAAHRDVLAPHYAKIRRKNEFADAFERFYGLGAALKEPIQIEFVDEFDIPEAGIDGGGVTKEFLTSVISQAFDPTDPHIEQPYFVENDKHLLYPSPTAIEDLKLRWKIMGFSPHSTETRIEVKNLLQQYEFLGRIIGKCLYEGILVDVSFAGFFLKKWALTGGTGSASMESSYRANINDLRELDQDLYRGLLALKNAPADEVEAFGLTFTIDELIGPEGSKQVIEQELMPNGANTPVTAENRLVYINRMSWYRLQGQSAAQTNAFLKGISSIIEPGWLSMFNQSELQTLVAGAQAEIDIADLRDNTLYGGTYVIGDDRRLHPSVEIFWEVMSELPDAERRKVLKFVTSTPRGPLLGFGQLNPRFSIRDSGQDENRYPTTSTCVNLLKLPMYKEKKTLRDKLLAAVNSGAGFDLS